MQITFKLYRSHDYDLLVLYQAKVLSFSKLVKQVLTAYAEKKESSMPSTAHLQMIRGMYGSSEKDLPVKRSSFPYPEIR